MYRNQRIAAVVPAHNEAANIKEVIATMPSAVDIIAITDDCSSDDTVKIVEGISDNRVVLIKHDRNTGVGGAIISAHQAALKKGSSINVVFAGDGQMDPDYLMNLLDPIIDGEYGYAKGNRLFSRTSHSGMPKYRIIGNYVLSYMNKAVSGYWKLSDPQNGYTAIRTDVLNEIGYESISQGYEFENDMLSRLNEYSIPVVDVPIPARYGAEISGIQLSKVIPALLKQFVISSGKRVFRKYLRAKKVVPTIASVLVVASAFIFIYSLFSDVASLTTVSVIGFILFSMVFVVYDVYSEPKKWEPPRLLIS